MSNHDKFSDLHPFIEPELEARVVAWVAGEASAFEASELERLTTEKPELAIFKRRIAAVHGLVAVAVRPPGEPLRLPSERRAKLLLTLAAADALAASANPQARAGDSGETTDAPPASSAVATTAAPPGKPTPAVVPFATPAGTTAKKNARYAWMRRVSMIAAGLTVGLFLTTVGHISYRAFVSPKSYAEVYVSQSGDRAAVQMLEVAMPAEAPVLEERSKAKAEMRDQVAEKKNAERQRYLYDGAPAKSAPAGPPASVTFGRAQPASAPAIASTEDGVGVLSPFEVTESQDTGYRAMNMQTMAGTRLNTTLPDAAAIGQAMGTELAAAFRKDLGATSVADDARYGAAPPPPASPSADYANPPQIGGVSGGARSGLDNDVVKLDSFMVSSAKERSAQPLAISGQRAASLAQQRVAPLITSIKQVVSADAFGPMSEGNVGEFLTFADGAGGGKRKNPIRPDPTSNGGAEVGVGGKLAFDEQWNPSLPPLPSGFIPYGGNPPAARDDGAVRFRGLIDEAPKPAATEAASKNAADAKADAEKAAREAQQADKPLAKTAKPDPAKLRQAIDEANAATQPVSTFSLHVSDVSFKLAQAALARGQKPEADRIRPEEFYNAFDYGDPSPSLGDKISCRIEQSAHPMLQQRNLVRIAMKVPAAGRGAGQPLRLTVMLDTSGSMEREDRVASVHRALQVLISLLGPNDRITLVGFSRQPRLLAEAVPGNMARTLLSTLARTPAEGGTNLEEALKLSSELARRHLDPNAQNRIVLITDGAANLGNADPEQLGAKIEALRQQGIAFDACGVGTEGLDDEVLEALTRKGDGRYYLLDKAEDADRGFARQLAGAFRPAAENVKVQVRFNPARVGAYRLIGFEQHRLKEEDFRNDKVDAAELAAEEAAVALYQVEVLPQGEGELGEVYVRFRDAATKQMVERSWTMAYEQRAPAFARATPSMQLAGTAAMVAEKLRGGALGDAVQLEDLAPVVNTLRSHFAQQARVQEFVTMFGQIRRMEKK